ncbi:MAG: hypothetical protein V4502_03515 [Pseudomonadota bacterium]
MNAFKAARLYRALKPYLETLEGKPLSSLTKNWKTTLAGVIGLFVVLGTSLGWLTHDQAQAIGAVAVSFGLMAAKDFNVSGGAKAIAFVLLALAMSVPARAQTPAPFQPQYYLGTGITYDYYGPTGFAANTEFGARVSGDVYSYSTLELTRTVATIRTGAAYAFMKQGRWLALALGDAGLASGAGQPLLGSFSGGGMLAYDIGAKLTHETSHFYIGVGGRVISTGGQTVQPIFAITLGKAF